MKKDQTIKEQFFEPIYREIVPEEEYKQFKALPATCESLSRICNQSVYIIDYSKQNFFCVSSHPLFLCGYTPEEVKEMGYLFYEKVLSPEDLHMVLEINKFGWSLFEKIPPTEVPNVCFSYDFYLHHKNGTRTLINHKLVPTFLTKNNAMWLAVCTVSFSSRKSSGNVIFTLNNRLEYYTYDFITKQIVTHTIEQLSKREKEVLTLLMRGFNLVEIAQELHISTHTVRTHRQHIEQKFDVRNTTSAALMFHSSF